MSRILRIPTIVAAFLLMWPIGAASLWAANPVPFLNNPLVPTSASPGGPSFDLIVNGANFIDGSTVYWNGSPRATMFISATQLSAQIFAGDVALAGSATVTVGNPGVTAFSNAQYFSIHNPAPALATPLGFALSAQQLAISCEYFAIADFNGDGNLDIAGINLGFTTVSIFLGNGDGTFQSPVTYPNPIPSVEQLAVGDFNNDGKLDLVVEGAPGGFGTSYTLAVLLGNGDGTFRVQPGLPAGASGSILAEVSVADFNGDGNLDLATFNTDAGTDNIAIWLGNGDGTFLPYRNIAVLPSNAVPLYNLAVGDFNRDGKLDLITFTQPTSQQGPESYYELLGKGDGTFAPTKTITTSSQFGTFVFGDVNGDGITDMVANVEAGVQLFRGVGNGSFRQESIIPGIPTSIALGDLNSDNRLDIVDVYTGLSIAMNQAGEFSAPVTWTFSNYDVSLQVGIADFNNDGKPDVMAGSIGLYLNSNALVSASYLFFPQGTVGTPDPPESLTVTNNNPTALELTGISISGDVGDVFSEMNDCGSVLRAHSSCTVTVTYLPTGYPQGSPFLNIGEGAWGTQSVPLEGFSYGQAPVVKLSGYQLNWGSVTVGQTGTAGQVQLTNIGDGKVRSLAVAISGPDASDFTITENTCPTLVSSLESCNISVVFTPTAVGLQTASLTFTDNAYGSPQTVSLSGTGQ